MPTSTVFASNELPDFTMITPASTVTRCLLLAAALAAAGPVFAAPPLDSRLAGVDVGLCSPAPAMPTA